MVDDVSNKQSADRNNMTNNIPHIETGPGGPVKQQVMVDPLISHLYCKVLESNWDPDLAILLQHYSPEQCINDIFESKENPIGINQKLKAHYDNVIGGASSNSAGGRSSEGGSSGGVGADDDDLSNGEREIYGLISELKYRTDLKSWKLTRIPS